MAPWVVGDLPFVYSVQPAPGNAGLPELLPFRLSFDGQDGYFTQSFDPAVASVLEQAYSHGSMLSGMMDEGGIGQRYAEDYLKFICDHLEVNRCRVLDVGCGTGYLLSKLQRLGAEVLGLEPGPHGQVGVAKYQVPIVRDYFPSRQVGQPFDLISAFSVLEHIVDPEKFLNAAQQQLVEGGWLVLGVPDCEPYIASGDVSFLFHEHWNYFSRSSIAHLIQRIFGHPPVVAKAGFGGVLYVAVQKTAQSAGSDSAPADNTWMAAEFAAFVSRAELRIQGIWKVLEEAWARGETVGVYVPWRAVNLLSMHHNKIPPNKMRFFDDNPLLHATYYPGFPIPVESRDELVARPPDRLLIMSHTFGNAIEQRLRQEGVSIPMHAWNELFGS